MTKPYACSRYCHSAIDAARTIRRRLAGFETPRFEESIDRIEVETFGHGMSFVAEPEAAKRAPRNAIEAQFSIHYATAVGLLDGAALLAQFAERRVARADVQELAQRVHVRRSDELDALYPRHYPACVRVHLRDGRVEEATVKAPTGDPGRAFTPAQFRERFESLLSPVLGHERVGRVWDLGNRIDELDGVSELLQALGPDDDR